MFLSVGGNRMTFFTAFYKICGVNFKKNAKTDAANSIVSPNWLRSTVCVQKIRRYKLQVLKVVDAKRPGFNSEVD